jgi:colanic acid/amylovoran biosynthesis glycosyltransferase
MLTNSNDLSMVGNQYSSGHPYRVVLIVQDFPRRSETFIVRKFLMLLEYGVDVHIVCMHRIVEEWHLFPQLPDWKELQHRVHVTMPERRKLVEALFLPYLFIRCLLLAPKSTMQYLDRGWQRFGRYILHLFYLDAELIILHPNLINYEFGNLARGHTHIKDLLDSRIIASFRGSDINSIGLLKPDYYREVWEKVDALTMVSKSVWMRAQQRGCSPDKRHTFIPSSIDTSFFTPKTIKQPETVGVPSRPYRILSVGRLAWVKGYEYALQAINRLVGLGISCEYRIIGDGPNSDAIRFTIRDLELENIVTLLGPGSQSLVKDQLEWADVFFHAAVFEGFCNAVTEAQAMYLPVVCTDAGGLVDNVSNEETGFVVPRRDWRTMADKLALLAGDPSLRTRMGESGRQRVIENFGRDAELEAWDEFYRKVLSE